jgi:uncharacterized protein (TIGR02099 family)
MKRLLRAIEMLAWGAFFVLALLVLALRFWVLPDIERYRDEIVEAMSYSIGLPVKVSAIEAGWLGLRPQITLTDVRIYDAQAREALVLPSIHNVLAWRSLLARELRLHQLVIGDGLRIGVRRDPAGELYVAGLKLGRAEGSAGVGGWLLGQSEIVVRNAEIEWRDEQRGAPPLVLSNLELKLVNSRGSHSVGLTARTPAELGGSIELRALVDGTASPDGRVFLQLGYTDLAAWRAWVDYPLDVQQGQGALRLWATLSKGELVEATADLALAQVVARLRADLPPLELDAVRGRLQGRLRAEGYEFASRGLALTVAGGAAIQPVDFQVGWKSDSGSLAASRIEFDPLMRLAGSLPLPAVLRERLAEFEPRGSLTDASFEWSGALGDVQRFSARSRFSELALRPSGALPGFQGLSGSLEATQEKGKLSLASRKSVVVLPRVFPEPRIALDSLAGELNWEHDGAQGLTVRVASLNFANEHASGNLFGSYTSRGDGPGSIDLSAVLNRADARHIARYLPHPRIMGETARDWIARAIVAGEASDVRVRVRGDLRQFPFSDPASGQFQVSARLEKGVLDYADGWPRVNDIVGELSFERDRVDILARSAAILGARLAEVRVSIPKLGRGAHVLVSGQADGPTAEFLNYIESSPLRQTTAGFTAGAKAGGRGKLHLKADLPLGELAKTRVTGEYEFAGNQLTVLSWLPPIEQAAGKLAFSESSFTLHDVRGKLLGGAVAISGGTRADRGLELIARGDAAFDATRALFDHPLRKHVSGSFAYVVAVNAKDGLTRVSFESPLRGIESALPAPLQKSTAESLPLRIEVNPLAGGERDRISVALGSIARAEVARRREGGAMVVQRTAVWLAPERDQPVRLPERLGTLVYGSLPEFDFDRWLPLFSGNGESQAVAIDLKFGALDAFGRRFSNVALRASTEAAGWSANVQADELAGDVAYRTAAGGRVIARLAHLTVPAEGTKPRAAAQPRDFPALDLVAEDFVFSGKQLGRVELVASRAGEDWRIESASMTNADASLTGRGTWRAAPSRTAVEFDLHAGDVGRFLARVGYPDLVKAGKAQLKGSLAWQGDPATLDFPTLGGALELRAEDGQFLEIEPGLGKLISLMSLQALPRRIALDFRDVFSKGFQFDRIGSSAQVERGVIKLKEFRMRGSAADVEMTGEADIAHETQNLRVRVVPSLGDSAALGLTLFNPVAGVAAAIAQRILKNPLGQIFAYDYSVSGSWSDPKVVKILPPPQPETETIKP